MSLERSNVNEYSSDFHIPVNVNAYKFDHYSVIEPEFVPKLKDIYNLQIELRRRKIVIDP